MSIVLVMANYVCDNNSNQSTIGVFLRWYLEQFITH